MIGLRVRPPFDIESLDEALTRMRSALRSSGTSGARAEMMRGLERNSTAAWTELETRFLRDRHELGLDDEATFAWIRQESHSGGRRPAVVGQGDRLFVYKPRSLIADRAWADVVAWFGLRLGETVSRPVVILDRGDYGWQAFVGREDCDRPAEIDAYYWRLGALAALLWSIGGFDASASNIVAARDHPTLIDAEMVLAPGNRIFERDLDFELRGGGVLPTVTVDLRGRTLAVGSALTEGVPCRHGRIAGTCGQCHCVPWLAGHEVRLDRHRRQLTDGFSAGLRCIAAEVATLTDPSGPLMAFNGARIRIAVRPTVVYQAVLTWLQSLVAAADAVPDLDQLLASLPTRVPLGGAEAGRILEIEAAALMAGDIPRFEMAADDRVLDHPPAVLWRYRHSPIERARRRLAGLGEARMTNVIARWRKKTEAACASASAQKSV